MKKVGIIGCGIISQVHAWVLSSMKDVELAGFCDIDTQKAVKLTETAGKFRSQGISEHTAEGIQPVICSDWRELGDSDIDSLHICTPHYLHAPMAAWLLRKGKAVFMEKPSAISYDQFEELKEEDARHPGKLGFCFQNRYNETTGVIDGIVSRGEIGKIIGGRAFVTWRRDEEYYAVSDWKGKLATEGGGALINQAVHTLDLLLRYLGEPVNVKAGMARHHFTDPSIEVEDTIEAWMDFESGARACFYASNAYASDAPVILELQGESGRVCMNGQDVTLFAEGKEPVHFTCDREQGIGKGYWGCGHKACIEDFYRKLENGERFQNDLTGVENTFRTMMRIYSEARLV